MMAVSVFKMLKQAADEEIISLHCKAPVRWKHLWVLAMGQEPSLFTDLMKKHLLLCFKSPSGKAGFQKR